MPRLWFRQQVDVRITAQTIKVCCGGKHIAARAQHYAPGVMTPML
jgi:hypothetical protein